MSRVGFAGQPKTVELRKWEAKSGPTNILGSGSKDKREDRGWTQAEMAKKLSDKGIETMHRRPLPRSNSVSGPCGCNEAAGIADLFEVSLDSLLGHTPGSQSQDLTYELRVLRDTARRWLPSRCGWRWKQSANSSKNCPRLLTVPT